VQALAVILDTQDANKTFDILTCPSSAASIIYYVNSSKA
jgi:hypothetical protein